MRLDRFAPDWSDADVDAAELWRRSGAQWLTAPHSPVPVRLVRRVGGLVEYLDARGAHLGDRLAGEGTGVLAERAALTGFGPSGRVSSGGATRLLQAGDGWLALTLARPDDIALLPALFEVTAGRFGPDPWDAVAAEVRRRPCGELAQRAGFLGMACARLGETQERAGVVAHQVGRAAPCRAEEMTVVNLASLWAGPLAADIMATIGARVVNVESTRRPDGARATGRFFDALRTRTSSAIFDLTTRPGRDDLATLIDQADVVIEGSRPRALRQLGIHAEELVARGPRIWVSITGHGRGAPHEHRIGFGDDAAIAGGLTGWDGAPTFLADAIADPLAGLTAAATIVQLAEHGGRWMVDLALARVAAEHARRAGDPVIAPIGPAVPPTPRSPLDRIERSPLVDTR